DGTEHTVTHADVLTADSRKDTPFWRHRPKNVRGGQVFTQRAAGDTKLHDRYVYTSVADVIHEDFTSYYPLLLTNMAAFNNPDLGLDEHGNPFDRYREIFHQKEEYGVLMKDSSLSEEERAHYRI